MFTGEVDCTYFFTWDTRYACVKEKEDLLCGASDGKKRYDLSALARHSGSTPLTWTPARCSQDTAPEYVGTRFLFVSTNGLHHNPFSTSLWLSR